MFKIIKMIIIINDNYDESSRSIVCVAVKYIIYVYSGVNCNMLILSWVIMYAPLHAH